jgi:hypothetical protein
MIEAPKRRVFRTYSWISLMDAGACDTGERMPCTKYVALAHGLELESLAKQHPNWTV